MQRYFRYLKDNTCTEMSQRFNLYRSNVLNFVPNHGTRILSLVGWYGLVLLLSSVKPHIYTFVVSRAFMAGAASQAGDADSSRAPGLTLWFAGVRECSTVVLYCWCHSDSASVLLYFTLDRFVCFVRCHPLTDTLPLINFKSYLHC